MSRLYDIGDRVRVNAKFEGVVTGILEDSFKNEPRKYRVRFQQGRVGWQSEGYYSPEELQGGVELPECAGIFSLGDKVVNLLRPSIAEPSIVNGITDNGEGAGGQRLMYRLRSISGSEEWLPQDRVRAWEAPVESFNMGDMVYVKGRFQATVGRVGCVDGMIDNAYCGEGKRYRIRTGLGEEWFAAAELEGSDGWA